MQSQLTVIGVDPGLADTGFGIVHGTGSRVSGYNFGTIRTSKHDNLACRLNHIYTELCLILDCHRPSVMAIESVFSLDKYPKSGLSLGKVCGVIMLAGARCGAVTTEVQTREVKRVLTGNGGANKGQVERAVRHFLKRQTAIVPSHASDALALALVGLLRHS